MQWQGRERRVIQRILGTAAGAAPLASVLILIALGQASAAPGCTDRPQTSADGKTVYGTPCADRIVVTSPNVREVLGAEGDDVIFANPMVEVVVGGDGHDRIYGELPATASATTSRRLLWAQRGTKATISLTERHCEANTFCFGGDGSQELIGSSGNDIIFGQRGNDVLRGESGNDELFGGIGDECAWSGGECAQAGIRGGGGDDLLSGGLGTDRLNGNDGSDLVRGDGTIDTIEDTGASGTDTLSFATGITPGFHGSVSLSGFPADSASEERGVHVRLNGETCEGEFEACDNEARYGGGLDNVAVSGFENVIGTPFADVIVGSSANNRIDGGGGADALYGNEGNDTLSTEGFSVTTTPVLLGGEGADTLTAANGTEDMLVDGNGSGNDTLSAGSYDDALINNEGADSLQGGLGNDPLLSAANCEGDTLQGAASGEGDGAAVNSSSWAKYPVGEASAGVVADLQAGKAGNAAGPSCSSGETGKLANIDDLEGSTGIDALYGDGAANNLLGRLGKDEIWGRAGADNIEAQDGIAETGGGGEGSDSCNLDASDKFNSCP
jgi:Ca2+-binding RTX toxin-like protein